MSGFAVAFGRALFAQGYASADLTHARSLEQVPFACSQQDNRSNGCIG